VDFLHSDQSRHFLPNPKLPCCIPVWPRLATSLVLFFSYMKEKKQCLHELSIFTWMLLPQPLFYSEDTEQRGLKLPIQDHIGTLVSDTLVLGNDSCSPQSRWDIGSQGPRTWQMHSKYFPIHEQCPFTFQTYLRLFYEMPHCTSQAEQSAFNTIAHENESLLRLLKNYMFTLKGSIWFVLLSAHSAYKIYLWGKGERLEITSV
jgi:hypothetical protein